MEVPPWNALGQAFAIHSQKSDFCSIDNSIEREVRINPYFQNDVD